MPAVWPLAYMSLGKARTKGEAQVSIKSDRRGTDSPRIRRQSRVEKLLTGSRTSGGSRTKTKRYE